MVNTKEKPLVLPVGEYVNIGAEITVTYFIIALLFCLLAVSESVSFAKAYFLSLWLAPGETITAQHPI